jgi:hypothetical protein
MKKLLISILVINSLSSFSQPIIVDGSNLQAVGSSNPGLLLSISDIGAAGANQTWDFSNESTSNATNLTVIDASSSTFGSSFPSANWSFELGPYYSYFESTSAGMECLAFNITSTNGNGDYTGNSRKILAYPFSYGDFFTDTYIENTITKNIIVTYDGYGTLLMPNGFTYTNVIRVKELDIESSAITTRFYLNNPLTIVATHLSNGNVFFWNQVAGTNEISENKLNSLNIFPNPAIDIINVSHLGDDNNTPLIVTGLDGRIVKKINNPLDFQSIDISSFSPGWYYISNGFGSNSFLKTN